MPDIIRPIRTMAEIMYAMTKDPKVKAGASAVSQKFPFLGGPLLPITAPGASRRSSMGTFSPRNSRLGGAFGAGIGSAISNFNAGQGQQQQDPMMALYEQLTQQLQAPVDMPTGVDQDDLLSQVKAALNPIYDQRSQRAQDQSNRGRAEVGNMYQALSNDYERLAPQQVAQAAAAKKEIEAMYGQLRSNVEGSYSRVSEEQADLFKQLGIEAALPDVLADQQAPVQEALTAASQNQTQQQQRYMDIGQMDATYMREGSPNATMKGNEVKTDMLAELEGVLGQIEAERSSGIQSGYMDQLSQANSQLAQQQQAAQSENGRRQEMLWQMLQSQLQGGQQQQQQKMTPDSFMGSLPGNQQQSVAGAFTRLQRSPEAVYGKVEDKRNPVPGSFVETTPEWYMAQADEMLRKGEIDPATHQQLLMYMQVYFGQGQ